MQEHLPPELRDMVKELIDSGAYANFEEIVHDALWLARDRFLLYKVKREELRALLDVAIQQSERGEVAPLDMEAIKAKAALRGGLVEGELGFAKLQERIKQRSIS